MMSVLERFWTKVQVLGPDNCWVWLAGVNGKGYGQFNLGRKVSKSITAHVFSWILENKIPVPLGLQLDHLCRVHACVNPRHLEPVTCRENLMRGDTLASANARKMICNQGHPLSGENLFVELSGSRQCRICRRLRLRISRQRRKLVIQISSKG